MASYYTILTSVGQAKVANAIALGQKVNLSTLAVGDANGVTPQPDANAKALLHERRRAPLNCVEVDKDNPNFIVCEQVLPPEVGGWEIREIGVFDDEGNLVAYGNYPPTYKPLLNEGTSRTQTVRMVMQVSDTAAITLKVDPSIVLATREYVDTEQEKLDQHIKNREAEANKLIEGLNASLKDLNAKAIIEGANAVLACIELYQKTPCIDFHFDNAGDNFTTRLIERVKGVLSCIGDFEISGALKIDGAEIKHIYASDPASYDDLPARTDTLITSDAVHKAIAYLESKLCTFDGVRGRIGWKRHPDGSIEQWGVSPRTGDKKYVPFPIPFPNECDCVIVCEGTGSSASPSSVNIVGVEQDTITREGFTQRVRDESEDVRYLAKGW